MCKECKKHNNDNGGFPITVEDRHSSEVKKGGPYYFLDPGKIQPFKIKSTEIPSGDYDFLNEKKTS